MTGASKTKHGRKAFLHAYQIQHQRTLFFLFLGKVSTLLAVFTGRHLEVTLYILAEKREIGKIELAGNFLDAFLRTLQLILLLELHNQGKSIKYISSKMGRSQTSIVMRLNKLKQ